MPAQTNLEAILACAAKFVGAKKGNWDHQGWEDFLGCVATFGLTLDDETKRHLGNILESSKQIYEIGGCHPVKKALAKDAPKAASKAKPKAAPKVKPRAAAKKKA